jgi:signal transduction histidine kinase
VTSVASLRRQLVARDTFLERVAGRLDAQVAALRDALAGAPLPEPAKAALDALAGGTRELGLIARPAAAVGLDACAVLDLAEQVPALLDPRRSRLADRGRGLSLSTRGPVHVACARDDVETVLIELLSNAVKYGQGPISVRVDATRSHARLTLRDGGAGIPRALRRRVFGRFVRGGVATPHTGYGVGLWLVRKIARGYGGDLRLGKDASFCVTFRLARSEPRPSGSGP